MTRFEPISDIQACRSMEGLFALAASHSAQNCRSKTVSALQRSFRIAAIRASCRISVSGGCHMAMRK